MTLKGHLLSRPGTESTYFLSNRGHTFLTQENRSAKLPSSACKGVIFFFHPSKPFVWQCEQNESVYILHVCMCEGVLIRSTP